MMAAIIDLIVILMTLPRSSSMRILGMTSHAKAGLVHPLRNMQRGHALAPPARPSEVMEHACTARKPCEHPQASVRML